MVFSRQDALNRCWLRYGILKEMKGGAKRKLKERVERETKRGSDSPVVENV